MENNTHKIFITNKNQDTLFGTDGLPIVLKDSSAINGELLLNYGVNKEAIYIKNADGNIVLVTGVSGDSSCSCPYTKDLLDEKFALMQSLIDILQLLLNEYINGKDVEETTLVENYTPNGEVFKYTSDINFKQLYLEAEIDLSTCLTEYTNENILSIGTDINLWGTSEAGGSGNVIHIYYTRSSYNIQVWCFNGYTATVNTNKILGTTDGSTTVTNPVDVIKIVVNSEGLFINDVLYATSYNILNILSLTSISVGSQEGSTRTYATYNYIKTVKKDTTTEITTDTTTTDSE